MDDPRIDIGLVLLEELGIAVLDMRVPLNPSHQ